MVSTSEFQSRVVPAVNPAMDHVERTKVQVQARLLQIVMEALCGGQAIPNTLIVVERIISEQNTQYTASVEQLADHITLRVRGQSAGPTASLLRQYPRIPIGWSTSDGEVFTRYRISRFWWPNCRCSIFFA